MVRLYIVSTPRHWIISSYLASSVFASDRSVLLVESTFDFDLFAEISKEKFDEVVVLEKNFSENKKKQVVSELFNRIDFGQILSGSVNEPFVQYAAYLLHQKIENNGFFMLDDGLFSYQPTNRKKRSFFSVLVSKLKYGFWYQEPKALKLSSAWVDGALLFFPEHLQFSFDKKIFTIDPNWLSSEVMIKIASKIIDNERFSGLESLKKTDVIVILDVYKNALKASKEYPEDVKFFLNRMQEAGKKIAIKYHPRDALSDPLEIKKKFPDQLLLPTNVPFELMSHLLKDSCAIVGDISTIQLEAKKFYPTVETGVSLIGSHDLSPVPLLEAAGVKIKKDYKALTELVE